MAEPPKVDWRKCPGREVLLSDLANGILALDEIEVSTDEAWENYRAREEFNGVPFSQFKRQLKAHREQIRKKNRREVDNTSGIPEDDDINVDWRGCAAREIILTDLREGRLSLDPAVTSTEEAWNYYGQLEEFELVPYEQFKRQLKAHREQVSKLVAISIPQELALHRDRQLFPMKTTNRNGEPLFYLTEAAKLLREDIERDLHAGLTPSQFRATREEYSVQNCGLTLSKFKQRIYQEIRFRKYCNYIEQERDRLLGKVAKKKTKTSRKRKTETIDGANESTKNAKTSGR